MRTNHILNRLIIYNPSDKIMFLADIDLYVFSGAIVDLCQDRSQNEINNSQSLKIALDNRWLEIIPTTDYSMLVDNSDFNTQGLFRTLTLGDSYSYNTTYSADICIVHDEGYYGDVNLCAVMNLSYGANIGITDRTPNGITGEDYEEVINKGIDPQIILFPKSGRFISNNGRNDFFGESKSLSSSNEVLYVHYQKTLMNVSHFIFYGLLKLNVARITGTASLVTINVYTANAEVDENTGWTAVSSSGSIRGALIGSQTATLRDDNTLISIDIYDYVQNYVYGDNGHHGVIIEMVPTGGTASMQVVGLYSWDNDVGEKQGPIIDIYYGRTPTSYVNAVRTLAATTEDTYIDSYNIYSNYGSESLVLIDKDGYQEKRGLFKFDFSDIPAGSDVIRAILYLPKSVVSTTNGQKDVVYRILQDWDESSATWLMADSNTEWNFSGSYYDDSGTYDSYNMIVAEENNRYDVTKLMQVIIGSFDYQTTSDCFGFMFKGQDLTFRSKEDDNLAYIDVVFEAKKLNQPPESATFVSPTTGSTSVSQPTFEVTINSDNAYGITEGDDLSFRLEVSTDMSFSDDNITSFSTSVSTTGWHWSALGDFSDDSTTFPITAGAYTAGTSRVKFIMSETTSSLTVGKTWAWRLVVIDV